MGPLSLVTLTTLSNEPIAVEMNPLGTCAATSSPLPTTRGRAPCLGGCGRFGAAVHAAARHCSFGFSAALAGAQAADAATRVASATALRAAYLFLRVRPNDLMAVPPHEQLTKAGVARPSRQRSLLPKQCRRCFRFGPDRR